MGTTMGKKYEEFVFGPFVSDPSDFVAHVPSALTTTDSLFDALQRELRLPDYFGRNFDALDECLGNLSWIESRRVIIMHDDVPSLPAGKIRIYREVLSDAVRNWHPDEDHALVVVFPEDAYNTIEQLMPNSAE